MKNSLYPFFWQHGENHEILRSYMEKIAESGMEGACIEARPHPEFVREGWWKDMDCIVDKAKQLSMKLWILDDSHFPTGYANGKIKECYPEYLKIYLDMRRYDVQGPLNHARINLALLKGRPWERPDYSEHVMGVYMAKRSLPLYREDDAVDVETMVDITECFQMESRLLTVDIPDGAYSIFVVYETTKGGEETTKDYLNPLVKEATQVLIDEVYEPHYKHYGKEFGKTIQGFFSDEPRFGNRKGTDAAIGRVDMVLPWREGMQKDLGMEMKYLPLLWVYANGAEKAVRLRYMDVVTRLYHENFTGVLAKWCKEHGVWYLGHNIEDNGAHARLGYGTGHYFRGQQEMDFAGIDVIGGQIVPGMNYHHDAYTTGGSCGEFYHYALAKLASSAAHLDPGKKGRAMCEAFGAYGWNEGLKTMKWIADSLMVRGINYIVPHAFNPKKFPDFDCPPHFYAHGHNPQFRYFQYFSNYVNRITELFSDGMYPAQVGVLYPAELEWAGAYMPVEKPAGALTRHQVAFDIVTKDYLMNAMIDDGVYQINQTKFRALVVPYGETIQEDLYQKILELKDQGIRVVFVNEAPEYVVDTENIRGQLPQKTQWKEPEIVSLEQLGDALKSYRSLKISEPVPDLVIGEYQKGETLYYMFFNESVAKEIHTEIAMPDGYVRQYDAFRDVESPLKVNGKKAEICLSPYETVVWIVEPQNAREKEEKTEDILFTFRKQQGWKKTELSKEWKVSFADSLSYPKFSTTIPMNTIGEIQDIEGFEQACGTLRYETDMISQNEHKTILDLGNAYETAEVFVNGKSAGVRLSKPYIFDLTPVLQNGTNHIAIEVTNTLGTVVRDPISHYLPIEPFGIETAVTLYEKQEERV